MTTRTCRNGHTTEALFGAKGKARCIECERARGLKYTRTGASAMRRRAWETTRRARNEEKALAALDAGVAADVHAMRERVRLRERKRLARLAAGA